MENWYKEKIPFFIEVEFNKLNENTQNLLLNSASQNTEILPGLKIKRLFNQITDAEIIFCDDMINDFNEIQEKMNNFKEKWTKTSTEKKINNLVKTEKTTDILTNKEKEIYYSRNKQLGIIDYDDVSQFPT